jgi:hypothetical protein
VQPRIRIFPASPVTFSRRPIIPRPDELTTPEPVTIDTKHQSFKEILRVEHAVCST